MRRSYDPKTDRIPPIAVTPAQKEEIAKLADSARMTVAEYVRERALGRPCPPAEAAVVPARRRAKVARA